MAPLQRLAVKPIEDPAEQAAIDERLKRAEMLVSGDARSVSAGPGVQPAVETSPSPSTETGKLSTSKRLPPPRRSTRKRRG
jgi:hypothetical protein